MADINPITPYLGPVVSPIQPDTGIASLPGASTTVANPAVASRLVAGDSGYVDTLYMQPDGTISHVPSSPTSPINYSDIVTKAYADIGRSGFGEKTSNIDQGGFDYWTGQLSSGAISPDQFKNVFLGAAAQNKDPAYEAAQEAARSKLVTDAYATLGRTGVGTEESQIDREGLDYWTGQLKSGAITPEQFNQAFKTAAEENYIKSAYKDIFGREAEDVGLGYWKDVLDTTNKADIYKQIAGGATMGEDVLGASKYLTGEYTPEAVKRYTETEEDLLNEYETFMKKGIDPTKSGLSTDYFSTVSNLYGSNVDSTINDVFGAGASDAFTAEQKQNFVDQLVSGETTREDVKQAFTTSNANKNQEASRIANIYAQAFGGDTEDAKALYAKLMGTTYTGTGKVDDEVYNKAKSVFDKSLTSETDAQKGITSLIKEAANKSGAESQKFFTDNPDLLTIYKDVGDTKFFNAAGTGGQYGYYKGIPVLKASEVDEVFDKMGTDYISGNAPDRLDNDIGWDTGSLSAVEARGAAALGVRKTGGYTDENGQTYPATYSGDLTGLATKLGIDPTQFKDSYKTVTTTDPETGTETKTQVVDKSAQDKLYDAVNEKAKDFYFIAGKTGTGKTNSLGETSAFTRDDVSGNHAAVLYKKEGDKLIPIEDTLKYYNGEMELKKGSWFTDTFGGIASIPGIAELSLLIPGVGPGTYAALKAAQTAALGGEFKDIAKSGAMAYAGAKYLPQVTSGISEGLSGAGITNELANKALTGATVGGGIAGLTGGSVGTGALMGGAGGALSYGASNLVPSEGMAMASELGIDPKYQKLFANTLARLTPTILTGGKVDPTKVLMSYLMSKGKEQIKEGIR